SCSSCLLLSFFFQAEDGIRDRNVTGVQTCALPILAGPAARSQARGAAAGHRGLAGGRPGPCQSRTPEGRRQDRPGGRQGPQQVRSEERRVGKEWRERWAAAQ